MKQRILLIGICLFLLTPSGALGSWLIDFDRFHVSVHGQTGCVECHGTRPTDTPHPDPGNVNKKAEDFFIPETCAGCHETVEDYVAAGVHGGFRISTPEDIQNCLNCHDPHYERAAAANDFGFDPEVSIRRQCGVCHEARDQLPDPGKDDAACVDCHRSFESDGPEEVKREAGICFHCHDKKNRTEAFAFTPLIDAADHGQTPHGGLSCRACHLQSLQYGHGDQPLSDCRQCHLPHDEKVAHDAHIPVSCRACHLGGVSARKNSETGKIEAVISRFEGASEKIHHMAIADKEGSCGRCHYSGNTLGASAMALPAKSILCMPCHAATLSAGDVVTQASLLAFILGICSLLYVLLSGAYGEGGPKSRTKTLALVLRDAGAAVFSHNIGIIVKSLVFDALLQKRLFVQSPSRWAIHALIFYPFVLRFCWGILALVLSLGFAQWDLTRILLDKNHPLTGFFFDVTGVTVFLGIGLAAVLKSRRPCAQVPAIMPKPDWAAAALLAGIVGAGFILEAVRIAMTGFPPGSAGAFLGYGMARTLSGMTGLSDIYGYIWYLHAILTGLFVAYLPFSRMLHMMVGPIVLAMNRLRVERK